MDIIATVKAKLLRYPHVRYTATERSITVEPVDESGFTVGVSVDGDHYTVNFDGWPTKWVLESQEGGAWVPASGTGLLLIPFWRPARVVHRRNRLFS